MPYTLYLYPMQVRTDVVKDSSGRSRGYGTVLFESKADAAAAMEVRRAAHALDPEGPPPAAPGSAVFHAINS